MRLYPARWRRRYGDEVVALIADAGADARMVADLLKTAVRMQFSTWSFPRLAAVLGLAGMLIGLAISFLTPVQYLARTQLHVTDTDSAVQTTEMLSSMVASRQFLTIVINDPKLDLYLAKSAELLRLPTSLTTCGAISLSVRTVQRLLRFSSLIAIKPKRRRLCSRSPKVPLNSFQFLQRYTGIR